MASRLPPKLLAFYRETDYAVKGPKGRFVLRVGTASKELAALLKSSRHACAAFITASNPLGEPTSAGLNAKALAALKADLEAADCPVLPGFGEGRQGWAGEESLLVLGLEREAAKRLARKYGQNALLWAARDAVPELILLR
ncbi:MAG: DUF3293 domain-containing protein [Elusimicrobia bacterium]|nr:DUF3293 domain-containing protein [Elusimicrobiota bacterium]